MRGRVAGRGAGARAGQAGSRSGTAILALGLDAIFFTDKLASNVFRPTELDFTPELIFRHERYEVHLAYERDMPVDQDSLMQQFVYLLALVSF